MKYNSFISVLNTSPQFITYKYVVNKHAVRVQYRQFPLIIIGYKDCDSSSKSDGAESERTSNVKDMREVWEKLRDLQGFLFSSDKSKLAIEIVEIVLQTKVKNLKQNSMEKYISKN